MRIGIPKEIKPLEGRVALIPDAAADLVHAGHEVCIQSGARAPLVVSREQACAMQPGSEIVDIAVDQGGCIETTHPTTCTDPVYAKCGAVIHPALR